MEKVILTGDRPTGNLHIGHYVGSVATRVQLQNEGNFDKFYIMIADTQALTDNAKNVDKVKNNIIQVAIDYLSAGIDPSKVDIFIQSQVPQLAEMTMYFMNLVTMSRLTRNPTVKEELNLRGFKASIPVGFMCYPISQASDILAFNTSIVPVGDDQLPMIEQAREIARSFENAYGEKVFTMPEPRLPENKACLRLVGLDGNAKMSKSLGNCIFLKDEPETIKQKIMNAYTDPNHIRVSDPGKVEGNVVFAYLDAFCKDSDFAKYLPDFENLDDLKNAYRKGGVGDVKIKLFLNSIIQELLEPIRTKRRELEKNVDGIYDMLFKNGEKASAVAQDTLDRMKRAMGIDYSIFKK